MESAIENGVVERRPNPLGVSPPRKRALEELRRLLGDPSRTQEEID